MSVHQCPFCNSKIEGLNQIEGIPIEVDLSRKQRQLFLVIIEAGPAGVSKDHLMKTLFKSASPTTLRTCIHQINKAIHPLHIKGHNNIYKFVIDKSK